MLAGKASSSESPLLTVDIGNTNVTIGLFRSGNLAGRWRISTNLHRMSDEYWPLLSQFLDSLDLSLRDVEAAIISSVVPPVLQEIREAFQRAEVEVYVLSSGVDVGLPVRYDPPSSVGADRLANALAVQSKYGQPAIIVDLGTATTLDVLDASGVYAGGAIAPGIETSLEGLFRAAFQLPRLALEAPPHAIGGTTNESIRSGTLFGYASLVDGLIERFLNEMEGNPAIVGTGGFAPLVAPHTKHVTIVNQDLTLEGLRLVYLKLQPPNDH